MRRSYSSDLAAIEAHPGEPLIEHLWSVAELAESTAAAMPGDGPVDRETLRRLAWILGASHDLAKATPYFQAHLRGQSVDRRLSSHALTSAMIGYLWVRDELGARATDSLAHAFLPLAVFLTVRRHHGFLHQAYAEASPDDDDREVIDRQWAALRRPIFDELLALVGAPWTVEGLDALLARFWAANEPRAWRTLLRRLERAGDVRFYLTENLLFSLLIDADRLRTAFAGETPADERAVIGSDLLDAYRRRKGWVAGHDDVASLREQLHAEVRATVDGLDLDDRFYSLTAPTGLGKTLT
ncbi:MAG: CRISPR-associated endonuclease Cas3'', partial [Chloroflexota bacterium]